MKTQEMALVVAFGALLGVVQIGCGGADSNGASARGKSSHDAQGVEDLPEAWPRIWESPQPVPSFGPYARVGAGALAPPLAADSPSPSVVEHRPDGGDQ